jgi:acetyltransferase
MKIVTTKDGTEFVIRPISKDDKQNIIDGLSKMSEQSIHHRFLGFKKGFSDKELKHLTEVDGVNHFAVAVGKIDANGELEGVGVARYHKLEDSPKEAEVAITIIDKFQGHGLGTALMLEIIAVAKDNGVEMFVGLLEETNDPMKALIKKLDGFTTKNIGDGTLRMFGDLSLY